MTNCCSFLVRLALATFVTIGAYQNLQNLPKSSETLLKNYQQFQTTFTNRTNLNFHEKISHSFLSDHAEDITKYLSWALIALSLGSLFVCPMLTPLVGLLYFSEQTIHLNFANMSHTSKLQEVQEFSLALFVLMTSLLVACNACASRCAAKVKTA